MSNITWPNWHDHHEQVTEDLSRDNQTLQQIILGLKREISELTRGARRANKTLTRTQQAHAREIKEMEKRMEKMKSTLQVIHTWATYSRGEILEAREVARQTAIALDRPDLLPTEQ